MNEKKLTRSSNKMICGVCAGIAEYFGIDPTIIRVIYAVCSLFLGIFLGGIILYFILALIMPDGQKQLDQ